MVIPALLFLLFHISIMAQVFRRQNKLYHHNMSEQGDVCKCNGPPPDTACVGAEECQVSTFE